MGMRELWDRFVRKAPSEQPGEHIAHNRQRLTPAEDAPLAVPAPTPSDAALVDGPRPGSRAA